MLHRQQPLGRLPRLEDLPRRIRLTKKFGTRPSIRPGLTADCPVKSVSFVPVDLLHGFAFELAYGFPYAEAFVVIGFEQSDYGFCRDVVVVALAQPLFGVALRLDAPFAKREAKAAGHLRDQS